MAARGAAGGGGGGRARGGAAPGAARAWADLPPELLEAVARAVPAGDRLWFRLVCRSWAGAGAGAAVVPGEEPLPPGKLTRTRGPDLAASAARAEMVLAVLERSPLRVKGDKGDIFYTSEVFKNIICPSSAEGGHLEVLQWARAQGCPWDERTCAWAARNGHLKVLKWARAQGCPWDERTCAYAAMNGHLEVLQWARAPSEVFKNIICPSSAEGGHLEVLQWARAQGCPWDAETCMWAASNGHLEVLQWARAHGCPWDEMTCF